MDDDHRLIVDIEGGPDLSEMDLREGLAVALRAIEAEHDWLCKAVSPEEIINKLSRSMRCCADQYRQGLSNLLDELCELAQGFFLGEGPEPITKALAPSGSELGIGSIIKAIRMRPHEAHLIPLTPSRIRELWRLVQEHLSAYYYKVLSGKASKDDIKRWRKLGLIRKAEPLTDYLADAWRFAHLASVMDAGADYTEMQRLARANPLSEAQQAGIDRYRAFGMEHARGLANAFMDGLMQRLRKEPDFEAEQAKYLELIVQARGKEEAKVKERLRQVVIDMAKAKKGRRALASELRQQARDWGRDWERIAATEFFNLEDVGRADEIERRHLREFPTEEADPWVIKAVRDTSCDGCKALFLLPDGRPRPFRLSWLRGNGSNAGRKWFNEKTGRWVGLQPQRIAIDDETGHFTDRDGGWLPVIGAVHPNCACPLIYYPRAARWATMDDKGRSQWPLSLAEDEQSAKEFEAALDKMFAAMIERRKNKET